MSMNASSRASTTSTSTEVNPPDQRVKVFRLQVENCKDFDQYTRIYRRDGRNQFDHNIYFDAATEEKLYDVVRQGKVPSNLLSVGQIIGWLMEKGIESLG